MYDGVALPLFALLDVLAAPLLTLCLSVVLLGTFLETALGDLQGLIERMDRWREERQGAPFPPWGHGAMALVLLAAAAVLGQLGVVALIGEGYGTLAWGFIPSLHPARAGLGLPPLAVARNPRESELIASGAASGARPSTPPSTHPFLG